MQPDLVAELGDDRGSRPGAARPAAGPPAVPSGTLATRLNVACCPADSPPSNTALTGSSSLSGVLDRWWLRGPEGCAVQHDASFVVRLVPEAAGDSFDLLSDAVAAFGTGVDDPRFQDDLDLMATTS